MDDSQHDPFWVYWEAQAHLRAACRVLPANMEDMDLLYPYLTLQAFAMELLLKCLLIDSGVKFGRTHSLKVLYAKLPADRQDLLSRKFDQVFCFGLKHVWKKLTGETVTIETTLESLADLFVQSRYRYEQDGHPANNRMGDALVAAIEVIHGLHPDWPERLIQTSQPTEGAG